MISPTLSFIWFGATWIPFDMILLPLLSYTTATTTTDHRPLPDRRPQGKNLPILPHRLFIGTPFPEP